MGSRVGEDLTTSWRCTERWISVPATSGNGTNGIPRSNSNRRGWSREVPVSVTGAVRSGLMPLLRRDLFTQNPRDGDSNRSGVKGLVVRKTDRQPQNDRKARLAPGLSLTQPASSRGTRPLSRPSRLRNHYRAVCVILGRYQMTNSAGIPEIGDHPCAADPPVSSRHSRARLLFCPG